MSDGSLCAFQKSDPRAKVVLEKAEKSAFGVGRASDTVDVGLLSVQEELSKTQGKSELVMLLKLIPERRNVRECTFLTDYQKQPHHSYIDEYVRYAAKLASFHGKY